MNQLIEEKIVVKKVNQSYSTVTDLETLTTNDLYVPYLTFIYHCKTNRFIYHKKELIESGEYKNFDIGFRMRGYSLYH